MQHDALGVHGAAHHRQHQVVQAGRFHPAVVGHGSGGEDLAGLAVADSGVRVVAIDVPEVEVHHAHGFAYGRGLTLEHLLHPVLVAHQRGRFVGDVRAAKGAHEALELL